MYGAWYVKRYSMHGWDKNKITFVQAWIFLEAIYFLSWIVGGIIFLFIANCCHMKTFLRTEDELQEDMNPWNNKNSEDYLRHLKFEFYTMNFQMTCILVNLSVAFVDVFGLK